MKFNDIAVFQPNVLHRTKEGYLEGRIRVTGAGVFTYMTGNGKVRRLRTVEEVGKLESYSTLNGQPVTRRHPSESVDPGNAKKLSVGYCMNDAYFDGLNLWITIRVTDAETIKAIESGELAAVSCGGEFTVYAQSGNWQGSDFDEIATDIKYNHLAIVTKGRAGDGVTIQVGDSADIEFFTNKTGESKMVKHFLDGAVFEVDEKVHEALNAAEKAKTEYEAKFKDQADQIEKLKAQVDTQAAEIKKMQDAAVDEAAINERVKEKLAVVSFAKEHGVEFKDEMTVGEIKAAVVAKVSGLSLEGKSEAYRDAAYDSAVAMVAKAPAKKAANPLAGQFQDAADENDPEKAYQAMKAKTYNIKKEG